MYRRVSNPSHTAPKIGYVRGGFQTRLYKIPHSYLNASTGFLTAAR